MSLTVSCSSEQINISITFSPLFFWIWGLLSARRRLLLAAGLGHCCPQARQADPACFRVSCRLEIFINVFHWTLCSHALFMSVYNGKKPSPRCVWFSMHSPSFPAHCLQCKCSSFSLALGALLNSRPPYKVWVEPALLFYLHNPPLRWDGNSGQLYSFNVLFICFVPKPSYGKTRSSHFFYAIL